MRVDGVKVVTNYKKGSTHGKIYFNIADETLLENLLNRRTRPYNDLRKMIPSALKLAGLDTIQSDSFRWSQKAGCGCGCSPGFVDKDYRLTHKDIYVTLVD